MASYTPNLDLLKKNPLTEGSDTFNVTTMLNDNWDKIDAGVGALESVVDTLVRPNLLKNGYFVGGGSQQGGGQFPINQRGATSYSGAGYAIDRWTKTNAVGTISINNSGVSIKGDGTYYCIVKQIIENPSKLLGKTVTISALLSSGNLLFGTTEIPTAFPTTETRLLALTYNSLGFLLYISSSEIDIRITTNSSDAPHVVAVKVELGSTQTLAHQENGEWVLNEIPDYNEELVRCMDTPSQIETGSYVGTGTYGVNYPNSLTFSFKPKMVFIKDYQSLVYGLFLAIDGLTATYQNHGYDSYDYEVSNKAYAKFNGLTLTWYNTGSVIRQMNDQNTYYYTAIG